MFHLPGSRDLANCREKNFIPLESCECECIGHTLVMAGDTGMLRYHSPRICLCDRRSDCYSCLRTPTEERNAVPSPNLHTVLADLRMLLPVTMRRLSSGTTSMPQRHRRSLRIYMINCELRFGGKCRSLQSLQTVTNSPKLSAPTPVLGASLILNSGSTMTRRKVTIG